MAEHNELGKEGEQLAADFLIKKTDMKSKREIGDFKKQRWILLLKKIIL